MTRALRFGFRAALLTSLCAACGGSAAPGDGPGAHDARRNVVLISLDTVRADRLGCYGNARGLTPALDAFARTATRYTNAWAASPWTLPSHASLFTGLYPFEHGAHTYALDALPGSARFNRALALQSGQIAPLGEEHVTLAEVLAAAGWRTGAEVANTAYLSPKLQLDQGFERWRARRGRANEVGDRALAWVDELEGNAPFLLFVNFMDAHQPLNTTPRPDLFPDPVPRNANEVFEELYRAIIARRGPVYPELLATFRAQYDLAIANLDEGVGRLLDGLRARGLFDDALIVIASDHGEFLGEHDLIGHAKDVYAGTMHVPLLVKLPGQTEGRTDDDPISHVHVPYLVLEHAGPMAGAAISLPPQHARDAILGENSYSRLRDLADAPDGRFDVVRRLLLADGHAFLHASDGREELYDLAADPDQEHDLLAPDGASPEWEARLAELLAHLSESSARPVEDLFDPEDLEMLRSLGYLGGDSD